MGVDGHFELMGAQPSRSPTWHAPLGLGVSLGLLAVGSACLSPAGQGLSASFGTSSLTLLAWFLILGSGLSAYNAGLGPANGLLSALGNGLFGTVPLLAFAIVCAILAYRGGTAAQVNWAAVLLAVPAILTAILAFTSGATSGDELSEAELAERDRLARGNPDPLSVEKDERLEPLPGYHSQTFAERFVIEAEGRLLPFFTLYLGFAIYMSLDEAMFGGRVVTVADFWTFFLEAVDRFGD